MKNKLLTCFLLLSIPLSATHLRCGYISVEVLSSTSRVCRITITVFTDAGSTVLFGGTQDVLDFGDGISTLVPETANTARPDLGINVGMASYSLIHTYPGAGNYTIQYKEPNRNGGIINMDNSVATLFSIETNLVLDPSFGNFSTPDFHVDPFFSADLGSEFSLSVGAFSQEDFVIQYEVTTPAFAVNYRLPGNFNINQFNGVIAWDTKFLNQYIAGEYLFAVKIQLFKMIDNSMYHVCTMVRDFQIVLTDDGDGGKISDDQGLDENNRIYIPENERSQIKIFYEATAPTELIAYSDLMDDDAFLFTTYDSSTNENIKVGVLTLTNLSSIIRDSPYPITVRGKDGAFASDICYLFYTKDLYPQIITRVEDELTSVDLFPNPVKDFVTISLSENLQGHYMIFNQTGRLISANSIAEKISIDMRSSPAGFYYCRIQTGRSFKFIKFIKN